MLLSVLMVVTLFWPSVSLSCGATFYFVAPDQSMPFRAVRRRPTAHARAVWMGIESAVRPRAPSRGVVDEYRVRAPVKAGEAPSPGTKCYAEADAEAPTNSAAYEESRPRRPKDDQRIISRNPQEGRVYRIKAMYGPPLTTTWLLLRKYP